MPHGFAGKCGAAGNVARVRTRLVEKTAIWQRRRDQNLVATCVTRVSVGLLIYVISVVMLYSSDYLLRKMNSWMQISYGLISFFLQVQLQVLPFNSALHYRYR